MLDTPNPSEPQARGEGNPQPMTPTTWRDATPAERIANAMSARELAEADHKSHKLIAVLMQNLALLCNGKKAVLASDVWALVADTCAAFLSKEGV